MSADLLSCGLLVATEKTLVALKQPQMSHWQCGIALNVSVLFVLLYRGINALNVFLSLSLCLSHYIFVCFRFILSAAFCHCRMICQRVSPLLLAVNNLPRVVT